MLISALAMMMFTAAPSETAAPDPDKVTCKSQPVLGSRLKKTKVCKTYAEWKAFEEDMRNMRAHLKKADQMPTFEGPSGP